MKPTSEQQAVIDCDENQVLVVAGPGSGKTTTIVERYVQRVKAKKERPSTTVMITFTVAMAQSLKRKIEDAGVTAPRYVGTLHGFAYKVLGMDSTQPPDIIDDAEREELVKALAVRHQIKKPPVSAILEAVVKPQGIKRYGQDAKVLRKLYEKELASQGLIDYDLIIPTALGVVNGRRMDIETLYVDEFQDTNPIDLEFYRALRPTTFVAIGDPDQAIYSFRGATDLALRTVAGEAQTKILPMTVSFRTPEKVARAANNLMERQPGRPVAKEIIPKAEEGAVTSLVFPNEVAEAQTVGKLIQTYLKAGVEAEEIAILCRYNRQAQGFDGYLRAMMLPVAETREPASPEQFVLAVFRAWLNPTPRTHNRLRILSGKSPVEGPGWYISAIPQLDITKATLINTLKALNVPLATISWSVGALEQTGGDPWATMAAMSEALARKASFECTSGITVTTMHASKGREWRVVFLPGFEQEIIPRKTDPERLEEERRLAFVALTRSSERVIVLHAMNRAGFYPGQIKASNPSQFLVEMGLLSRPGEL